ncbi:hypothetical protein [Streptosporangium minutum]|nr:hypothetical protein [Streptosporangium minutum]
MRSRLTKAVLCVTILGSVVGGFAPAAFAWAGPTSVQLAWAGPT